MSRKTGLTSILSGVILLTIGFTAGFYTDSAPVCGRPAFIGPLVTVFGVDGARFLCKYTSVFIIAGGLFVVIGILLMIWKRKKMWSIIKA